MKYGICLSVENPKISYNLLPLYFIYVGNANPSRIVDRDSEIILSNKNI